MADTPLVVAAAVIVRGGRLLIARRPADDRHAGLWELPGGKAREGESPAACLERELEEELGITARVGAPLCSTRRDIEGRTLELEALLVRDYSGEPQTRAHDRIEWASPEEWRSYRFLEPDVEILRCLRSMWNEVLGGASGGR